ncbi:hypothetical protein NDU88_003415 [Pleurodeles waltl]|uniref:Uncharacterized protein n=1 Tax=Pleurodeles waltl TaxID=8319 RepID=A0AAV7UBZ8_PLEWA|nr:hypothetical protein NDU88_003415 [Pleurodeles waltl]
MKGGDRPRHNVAASPLLLLAHGAQQRHFKRKKKENGAGHCFYSWCPIAPRSSYVAAAARETLRTVFIFLGVGATGPSHGSAPSSFLHGARQHRKRISSGGAPSSLPKRCGLHSFLGSTSPSQCWHFLFSFPRRATAPFAPVLCGPRSPAGRALSDSGGVGGMGSGQFLRGGTGNPALRASQRFMYFRHRSLFGSTAGRCDGQHSPLSLAPMGLGLRRPHFSSFFHGLLL